MGRRGRTKEVLRTLQKSYRKKVKRDADSKQVPTLRNFELERNTNKDDLILYVWDLLGDDTTYKSKILSLTDKKSTKLIDAIECPCCGNKLGLDKRWNCFICQAREKKIYEIFKIENITELIDKGGFKGE